MKIGKNWRLTEAPQAMMPLAGPTTAYRQGNRRIRSPSGL